MGVQLSGSEHDMRGERLIFVSLCVARFTDYTADATHVRPSAPDHPDLHGKKKHNTN